MSVILLEDDTPRNIELEERKPTPCDDDIVITAPTPKRATATRERKHSQHRVAVIPRVQQRTPARHSPGRRRHSRPIVLMPLD